MSEWEDMPGARSARDEKVSPYVKLTLWEDLTTDDERGYLHMPLVIESWPPGLDVRLLLEAALALMDGEEVTD